MPSRNIASGTRIRRAVRADSEFLLRMIAALAAHHGDRSCASRAILERDIFGADACAQVLLAERAGMPVGYALFSIRPRLQQGLRLLDIHHLYVDPDHRGIGVGRHLIAAIVEQARRQYCGRVVVGTLPDNLAAQKIYRGIGFSEMPPGGPRFLLDLPGGNLPDGWI
ncbi:GNAT family N-acetyltransferase [Tropicimonas sp.]|uniref:GNAT family N-acetyltransferase n=1 Tax=Tropicimonas sp. TaxID=2067044 RepID=UPI003A839FC8